MEEVKVAEEVAEDEDEDEEKNKKSNETKWFLYIINVETNKDKLKFKIIRPPRFY